MNTTPVREARTPIAPPPTAAPEQRGDGRERALSGRIRRVTVRRRLLQVTDALAVADLLLGMNNSLTSMGEEEA